LFKAGFAVLVFCIICSGLFLSAPTGSAKRHISKQKASKRTANPTAGKRSAEFETKRQEIDAHSSDARYLLMRTAVFDPLSNPPDSVRIGQTQLATTKVAVLDAKAVAQAEAQSNGYYIIQYRSSIQPAWADELRAQGMEIAGYLANNAYIVKSPLAKVAQLQSSSSPIRWMGAYGAGLKVDPDLATLANDAANQNLTATDELIYVSFLSFKGASAASIREAIGPANDVVIEERNDERVWGVLAVRRDGLPQLVITLASVEAVEWVEQRRPHRLFNDNAVRAVQTGTIGDTPLYRQGLTGAGQIYGTADSGLDSDHSQFRLSGDASAQTLSYATSTATLISGLLPFKVTNQNNKVLTYYLLGSSSFAELKDNPNGGQTLDATKQSGSRYLNAVAYDDSSAAYHGTLTTSVAVGRNYGANGSGALPGITTRSTGDGVAPDAKIVFQDVGHPSGQLPGVDFVSQALIHQQAYSTGVRVHSNSYGPEPPATYDQDAADVDEMMWRLRDYTILFAAGNDGAGNYQVTNAAKNNIVVGATDSPTGKGSLENLASYSNHGPTFDGRIKPDIVAPGTVIGATENDDDQNSSSYNNSTSATAKDAAVNPDDPNNNSTLLETAASGTSFSTPVVAGGALLARQYFTDGFYPAGTKNAANGFSPSNALIKAVILNSGRNLTGRFTASNYPISKSGALPNSGQGWGRMALDDALYFAGDRRELKVLADIWNGATAADSTRPAANPAITTGQTQTYQITSVSNVEPLRITLAWSDPRAAIGSVVALVNNLNLEVTDPQGNVFRGNVNFKDGWSLAAGSTSFDNRNPVEAVYIQNPIAGTYSVRVIGQNVPGNGRTQITAQPGDQKIDSNRQGYALVATGNFSAGVQPVLNLAATTVNGGVNADPFISRNETVTANLTVTNPSSLPASAVSVQIAVADASQVPSTSVRVNGQEAGRPATISIGDIAAGATKSATFQVTLLDDGQQRVGQGIVFNVTMTPSGGIPFTTQFTILAQLKLVTYRTRFEPASASGDAGGAGVIVIPESSWVKRKDNPYPAKETDTFYGDWLLTTDQHADGSSASLSDPSGAGKSYSTASTSRSDGQVYDDTRWWTPKLLLPGLLLTESTGLASNPETAQNIRAEIDSFDVDVKADFTGDVAQSSSSGDFFILRVRPYTNTVSIRSTDDSGFDSDSFTNLLQLDAGGVANTGFIHYSGNNFAGGDGVFHYEEDDDTKNDSDTFFRIELQFRRNGFPQTGDGVFVDNLVVRLRVADTAVYASPSAGTVATVNAASYERAVAPGQIVAAFGSGFPSGTAINAAGSTLPLPSELEKASVRVNGVAAPLFYAGAGGAFGDGVFQINYQLPFETAAGTALVEVFYAGKLAASEYLTVSSAAPGVFTANSYGQGQAVALNQDYTLNGDPAANPNAKPESRGRYLVIYANGQGGQLLDSTTLQLITLPSGYAAPSGTLYVTANNPTVTIGGIAAPVAFSGLSPGFVGLWQINVQIPANAPTGNSVPLVISFGEKNSRTTTIAIN
jgi:uncharacterized protein (TIGR03437 family)